MRAQSNKLNIKIEKHLDPALPIAWINQQSIGRAFLNIINNGLYAANERAAKSNSDFMPTISIATSHTADTITVKIRDNGDGISSDIKKRIFEPFFTTKSSEHGTGLGLALCYDIVVKEHEGTISVDSKSGEYTEFTLTIPIKAKS
jgi:signal transduction histidine kinase